MGQVVEMGLARRTGCNVDPSPVAPLALNLVMHDRFSNVFEPGFAEPVVALAKLKILFAAMAMTLE